MPGSPGKTDGLIHRHLTFTAPSIRNWWSLGESLVPLCPYRRPDLWVGLYQGTPGGWATPLSDGGFGLDWSKGAENTEAGMSQTIPEIVINLALIWHSLAGDLLI